jgi:hypothetical protein
MNRDIDSPDRTTLGRSGIEPETAREPEAPPLSRERETIEMRGYRYRVSPMEVDAMRDIGSFRTVALDDLARFRYCGQTGEMRDDLESLRAQGLVQQRTVWAKSKNGNGEKFSVVVLTKTGKDFLERDRPQGASQKFFSGFVKPAEVRHDAAIYRMYQLEAERIRRSAGRVTRIVLDYELKQNVYSPLAKANALPALEYARRQAEIAAQNGLKVVHGKILLPDLRIEYESSSGERAHVDLELATEHYRGSHMRGKAEAGFKFYAPQESVGRLTSAFDPEYMAEIFSL